MDNKIELKAGKLNLIYPERINQTCYKNAYRTGLDLKPSAFRKDLESAIKNNGDNILWEYPESFLHPNDQLELADQIIKLFLENPETKCIWGVETFSEAIMLRIKRRISEGFEREDKSAIKASDINILSVTMMDDFLLIKNIKLDEDGEFLSAWPNGFFNYRIKEHLGE